MTLRKRRIILLICSMIFLAAAPLLLFYTLGYRLDGKFRISKTGGLYISSPLSGSKIFVEEKMEKQTNILQGGIFLQNLRKGNYPVLVTKEGYWPWQKNLNIKEGMVAEARAFLIPQTPQGQILLKGSFSNTWASPYNKIILLEEKKSGGYQINFYLPATNTFLTPISPETTNLLFFKKDISKIYWKDGAIILTDGKKTIQADFNMSDETVTASTKSADTITVNNKYEKFSRDKKERLWLDDKINAVWLDWLADKNSIPYYLCDTKPCESTTYLISGFTFPVKNTDFFPNRKDVIILAAQNNVFAMEIDGRGGRLSQPIYKGKDPTFTVFPNENKVYILDDGVLIAVNLE